MTDLDILFDKEIAWTNLDSMMNEIRRNHKQIKELKKRNRLLENKMKAIGRKRQLKAQMADIKYYRDKS